MQEHSFLALATSASVVRRAVKVALIVGTILGVINHADAVLTNTFSMKNWLQVALTYFVPYAVATYSAVNALQDDFKKTQ
jgi:uncharacterized membrane protein